MRKICVLTTSRADYGIYTPVLKHIQRNPALELQLVVSGMHFSPEFGLTVKGIEADGFDIADRVEMLLSSDTPQATAKSMGMGTIGLAQTYARLRPDMLLVLGDRFEMHAGVSAAIPFRIPVAHIAGGELTEGSLDDLMRHSISKLSHLHFVSTEEYKDRLIKMGEEPWRIHVTGSPSLDHLSAFDEISKEELERDLQLRLDPAPILVTLHPETQDVESASEHVDAMLAAIEQVNRPIVFTASNTDPGSRIIMDRIMEWVATHDNSRFIANLGSARFYSLLSLSAAMVGNSSSGIVEAASFTLPVINLGTRQQGRPRQKNVIDSPFKSDQITSALKLALSSHFRESLQGLINPFGDGRAGERITRVLAETPLNKRLLIKRFHDVTARASQKAATDDGALE